MAQCLLTEPNVQPAATDSFQCNEISSGPYARCESLRAACVCPHQCVQLQTTRKVISACVAYAACQLTLSMSFETATGLPLPPEVGDQICPPCREPTAGSSGQLHCTEAPPAEQPLLESAVDMNVNNPAFINAR